MKILVASENPVKISSVKAGFEATFPGILFECSGRKTDSGVPEQPGSDAEAIAGARNRVRNLRRSGETADYFVAIEGGIDHVHGKTFAFAWACVENAYGKIGEARTVAFEVPPAVVQLLAEGIELGHANDRVFGTENSKQKNGALGILTNDLIPRTTEYFHAVISALIPFQKHADQYDER